MRVQCNDNVKPLLRICVSFLGLSGILPVFSQVPNQAKQLIVAIAPEWSSPHATMQCWQRESASMAWKPVFGDPWTVNLGRNGLAWGRGVFSPPSPASGWKMEKDGKAPA